MNPIEAAVLPLKGEAMDRAEKFAREFVEKIAKQLAEAGGDVEKAAPFPKSFGASREAYVKGKTRYDIFRRLTKELPGDRGWRRPGEPHIKEMDPERIEKFVQDARENAAFQYVAFVAKLNNKIGETTEARLEGNHVWGYSILIVKTVGGAWERWKTQTIINVSKLGKVFNQYPTRKVKNV